MLTINAAIGWSGTGNVEAPDNSTSEPAIPISNNVVQTQSVIVQADPNNTDPVYIGPPTINEANSIVLLPGQDITIDIRDVSKIYCLGASAGQIVRWIALSAN